MSATLQQIFALNPTTTIGNNDLLYLVQSPYTPGTDAAILGSDLKALFVSSTAIVDVAHGGTGSTSFTPHTVIIAGANPTDPLTNVAGTGVLGQVLTSLGPLNAPIWANNPASGTVNPGLANEIAYYAAPGSVISPISPTQNNGLLVTSNVGVPSILAGPGVTGKLLFSNAAASPNWTTPSYPTTSGVLNHFIISDGTNNIYSPFALLMTGNLTMVGAFSVTFNFTNNTNVTFPTTGTLATTSQLVNWNNVTSTPILLVDNNGYIVNNGAALVTFQLPATAPIGTRFAIVGHDVGGWKVTQSNVNQHIHVGNATSTVGLAGFIASSDGNDCIELICTGTDNEFTARTMVGNITIA